MHDHRITITRKEKTIVRENIRLGATVEVRDRNKVRTFTLVGGEEVDAENGKISLASPIGRALVGRTIGDRVSVRIPKGELSLEILGFHLSPP